MQRFLPNRAQLFGFITAFIVLNVIGATVQTQFNLGHLLALGIDVPFSTRISTTLHDIVSLQPLFGAIFGIGFLIAMIVGHVIAKAGQNPARFGVCAGRFCGNGGDAAFTESGFPNHRYRCGARMGGVFEPVRGRRSGRLCIFRGQNPLCAQRLSPKAYSAALNSNRRACKSGSV